MAHVEEKSLAKIGRKLHDVISTLTHHLTGLDNGDGSNPGLGIVMLVGSNKGAVMKGTSPTRALTSGGRGAREEPKLTTYTNSNYQFVNNSIMIDGRVEAKDPGVHIEIMDCVEEDGEKSDNDDDDEHEKGRKKKKAKKESSHEEKVKKEKKEKESSHEEEEKEKKEKGCSHVEKGKGEKGSG